MSSTSQHDPRISVCIVCRNEADRLEACLQSVSEWADEVIVMDLSSTDDSVSIAEANGARVVTREPAPIVEWVRNDVAALASGDWILAMDPDERVTPGLRDELRRASSRSDIDLVVIPFQHRDFGYAARSPLLRYDPKPRMYRRDRVRWPTIPNKLPQAPEARTYRIPADDAFVMIHERNRSIVEALDRVVRYAPVQAQAMVDAGQVFTARSMFATLGKKSLRQFHGYEAAADGVPGIVRAGVLVAFHFYVWAAFWQLSGAGRTPADDAFVRRLGMVVGLVGRTVSASAAVAERLAGLRRSR